MTNESMIFNLKITKDIMTDAVISGLDSLNHFDGAKEYINAVINELSERQTPTEANKEADPKQLNIADVRLSLFNEVYDKLIEVDRDLVRFESWVNRNC